MIIAKNVSKSFGTVKALDSVSFSISKGEVAAILGANGAGKTTLIRLLVGYLEPSQGEIGVYENNKKLDNLEVLQRIGYVPENCPLYEEMTVYEFLKFCADLRNVEFNKEIIKTLSLESVLDKKIETLSKGFKRRVGLAGGIIHKPQILILDEPTEGLDPNQKAEIRSFIQNYGKDNIVLVSTHIMEEVEAVSTRILMLNKGKLVADKKPVDFKKISQHYDITESFRELSK